MGSPGVSRRAPGAPGGIVSGQGRTVGGGSSPVAADRCGQGRAESSQRDAGQLPPRRGRRDAAVRRRAAHRRRPRRRRGRTRHRQCGPASASRDPRPAGYPSEVHVLRSGRDPRKGRATSSASSKTGRHWPARPGSLDQRGRPVRGLPAMVVGGSLSPTPRPRGAARSSRTVRSPNPVAPRRWKSAAPAPKRHWHSSGPPAGSASLPRPGSTWRRPSRHPRRRGDRRPAHPHGCTGHPPGMGERRMRREVRPRPIGSPTSTTPICAGRRERPSLRRPAWSARWRSRRRGA